MYMASYDWRLSPHMMERRDGYMTRLKAQLEANLQIYGTPSVIMSHSYGSNVSTGRSTQFECTQLLCVEVWREHGIDT
jgi:Lecithin:cholesterol acyltransferase